MSLLTRSTEFEEFARAADNLMGVDLDRDWLLELWNAADGDQNRALNFVIDTPKAKVVVASNSLSDDGVDVPTEQNAAKSGRLVEKDGVQPRRQSSVLLNNGPPAPEEVFKPEEEPQKQRKKKSKKERKDSFDDPFFDTEINFFDPTVDDFGGFFTTPLADPVEPSAPPSPVGTKQQVEGHSGGDRHDEAQSKENVVPLEQLSELKGDAYAAEEEQGHLFESVLQDSTDRENLWRLRGELDRILAQPGLSEQPELEQRVLILMKMLTDRPNRGAVLEEEAKRLQSDSQFQQVISAQVQQMLSNPMVASNPALLQHLNFQMTQLRLIQAQRGENVRRTLQLGEGSHSTPDISGCTSMNLGPPLPNPAFGLATHSFPQVQGQISRSSLTPQFMTSPLLTERAGSKEWWVGGQSKPEEAKLESSNPFRSKSNPFAGLRMSKHPSRLPTLEIPGVPPAGSRRHAPSYQSGASKKSKRPPSQGSHDPGGKVVVRKFKGNLAPGSPGSPGIAKTADMGDMRLVPPMNMNKRHSLQPIHTLTLQPPADPEKRPPVPAQESIHEVKRNQMMGLPVKPSMDELGHGSRFSSFVPRHGVMDDSGRNIKLLPTLEALDSYKVSHTTEVDLEKAFQRYDKRSREPGLDWRDSVELFNELGMNVTEHQVKSFVKSMDQNDNQRVEFPELLGFWRRLRHRVELARQAKSTSPEETILARQLFEEYSDPQKGMLTFRGFKEITKLYGMAMNDDEIRAAFDRIASKKGLLDSGAYFNFLSSVGKERVELQLRLKNRQNLEDTALLRRVFMLFDHGRSGSMNAAGLYDAVIFMGFHVSKEGVLTIIIQLLKKIDLDGNGTVELNEFFEFFTDMKELQDLTEVMHLDAKKGQARMVVLHIMAFICALVGIIFLAGRNPSLKPLGGIALAFGVLLVVFLDLPFFMGTTSSPQKKRGPLHPV